MSVETLKPEKTEYKFDDISVEHSILHLCLNHDFWTKNQSTLSRGMFPSELGQVYDALESAHSKHEKDLEWHELWTVLITENPSLPQAKKDRLKALFSTLSVQSVPDPAIGSAALTYMLRKEVGREAAHLSLQLMEGNGDALGELDRLLERHRDGLSDAEGVGDVSTLLDDVLRASEHDFRWKTNIPCLETAFPGVGPGTFGAYFARPEVGKTAFGVHLICGPDGYLEQGARVLYIGNEEPIHRTILRCICACSGFRVDDIRSGRMGEASRAWDNVRGRFHPVDGHGFTVEDVDRAVVKFEPDIVVIDQLDKVGVDGKFNRGDEKLQVVYEFARDLAAHRNVAVLGCCQASAEAEGKAYIDYSTMAGSKTGKAGELDIAIGIGKGASTSDEDPMRYFTVSKNKLTGVHGRYAAPINPHLSRFER